MSYYDALPPISAPWDLRLSQSTVSMRRRTTEFEDFLLVPQRNPGPRDFFNADSPSARSSGDSASSVVASARVVERICMGVAKSSVSAPRINLATRAYYTSALALPAIPATIGARQLLTDSDDVARSSFLVRPRRQAFLSELEQMQPFPLLQSQLQLRMPEDLLRFLDQRAGLLPHPMVYVSGGQEADPSRHTAPHPEDHHEHYHHVRQEHHYHEDDPVSPIVTVIVVFCSTLLALRLIREIIVAELRERREEQLPDDDGVIQVNEIPGFVQMDQPDQRRFRPFGGRGYKLLPDPPDAVGVLSQRDSAQTADIASTSAGQDKRDSVRTVSTAVSAGQIATEVRDASGGSTDSVRSAGSLPVSSSASVASGPGGADASSASQPQQPDRGEVPEIERGD